MKSKFVRFELNLTSGVGLVRNDFRIYLSILAIGIVSFILAKYSVNFQDYKIFLVVGSLLVLVDFATVDLVFLGKYGLLSNLYSLLFFSSLAYILSFLSLGAKGLAFVEGITLTQCAGMWGDLYSRGNYDNWLWILNDNQIYALRQKLGSHFLTIVIVFFAFFIGAFALPFFALLGNWRIISLNFANLRLTDPLLIGQIALVFLLVLIIWLTSNCFVTIRKYQLSVSRKFNHFDTSSLHLIWEKIIGKTDKSANYIIRQIQREQLLWIIVLIGVIVSLETAIYLLMPAKGQIFLTLFFLTPFIVALLWGSFAHTTTSELGGVYGVLLSALVTWIISLLSPTYTWDIGLLFYVFSSAVSAWVVGLLSGIVVKGIQRMSMLVYVNKFEINYTPTIPVDYLAYISKGLENGYCMGMQILNGKTNTKPNVKMTSKSDLVISTGSNAVLSGDKMYQFTVLYRQKPVMQQLNYSLCANRLLYAKTDESTYVLPVLPVNYLHPSLINEDSKIPQLDLDGVLSSNGKYSIKLGQKGKIIELPAFISIQSGDQPFPVCGYSMSVDGFFDQMLTRSVDVKTDVFCYLENNGKDLIKKSTLWIVGFCRGQTSTKSYVTMEAETIASEVVDQIEEIFYVHGVQGSTHRMRLYYPKVSIHDYGFDPDQLQNYINSSTNNFAKFSFQIFDEIQRCINYLPEARAIPTLTSNVRKQLIIWFVQVAFSLLAATSQIRTNVSGQLFDLIKIIFGG
jgi:hypothetical protein